MKRIYFLILFLILLKPIFGQQFDTDFIINRADSILKKTVGDSIYKYFKYDTDSYYEYVNRFGKTNWETLNKKPKTKGDFVEVSVRFYFDYPNPKEIGGTTHVKFDKNLLLQDSLYLDFLPDFLRENRECDFLDSTKALEIAKDSILKNGLYDLTVHLHYDRFRKKYVYVFDNILSEDLDFAGNKNGDVEIVEVDAVTGSILDRRISWYGPIY